jgi:transcriptional regulator with XRE-family HTH domain
VVDRINEIIRNKNLSPSQFADAIGIQRSGMSHLLSGRNKPSLEFVLKTLKAFPEIDPVWLLLGERKKEVQPVSATDDGLLDLRVEEISQTPPPPRPEKVKEKRSLRKAEKMVVFYDDRTFEMYYTE